MASDSKNYDYIVPQDVVLEISYRGHYISYIQIDVIQSSPNGTANITRGGIGQREIVVDVRALRTNKLYYKVWIYGYEI